MNNTEITTLENAIAAAKAEYKEASEAFQKIQRRGASDRFASWESFKKRFTALEDRTLTASLKIWNLESELAQKTLRV